MSEPGTTVRPGPPEEAGEAPARRRIRRSTILLVALAVVGGFAFATVFAYGVSRLSARSSHQVQYRPAGIPASVSTSLAYLMQLSPVPHHPAPPFTLTDQAGRPVSMSAFRGKTVVLTFMDSHCTDICPLVSREFIGAHKDLGAAARNVVFVAVNVNPYHNKVSDVASFSRAQRLDSIGAWYFVTGPVAALRSIWNAYQVQVEAPSRNADVLHTSLVYVIDKNGRERYVAEPTVDHTKKGASYLPPGQLAAWSRGIALVARSVTP
ncbi:MAG TPA: SCO family protein [Streptosporangiaceae bacterium]